MPFRASLTLFLIVGVSAKAEPEAWSRISVWPPPRSLRFSGPPRRVHGNFRVEVEKDVDSATLRDGIERYESIMRPLIGSGGRLDDAATEDQDQSVIQGLSINVHHPKKLALNFDTDYSYTLTLEEDNPWAKISAPSVYGALYGLESFTQLLSAGNIHASQVKIVDRPQYPWRGFLIDAGRRFFPVSMVKNLLDTMAAIKLNVLHFHLSDHCRFAVESKRYPNLTASLTGDHAGHYTHDDIHDIIAYAKARGIRVVPEFDIPGHSRAYAPLEYSGDVQFCRPFADTRTQLYNDPDGQTFRVLSDILGEMAELFEDEVFHAGCDETRTNGRCDLESTFNIERRILETVEEKYNKVPAAWEESLSTGNAATENTIVTTWTGFSAKDITATGRRAIECSQPHFYLTFRPQIDDETWSYCHHDIAEGIPVAQRHLLMGGQLSFWTDKYVYAMQCGTHMGPPPVAHYLYSPSQDEGFAKSFGGMVWPRGFVGAASLWNYQAERNDLADKYPVHKISAEMARRGTHVCPKDCSCDHVSTVCPTAPTMQHYAAYEVRAAAQDRLGEWSADVSPAAPAAPAWQSGPAAEAWRTGILNALKGKKGKKASKTNTIQQIQRKDAFKGFKGFKGKKNGQRGA